ncbi:leucine-rich repeat-containing protein 27 isoform X1 [Pseudorca crassidens]|uniref:leucine-rich repeat-containing protein 27 isoform X1 n=1 Tax=Pseudorca crassidens TaxID=82174 RepID=UPI00352EF43B
MVNLKCEPSRVYPAVPRRAHRQVPRRPLRRGARSRITTLRASAHMSPSSGTLHLCMCHRLPGRGGRGRRASAAALRLRADRWSLDECHVRRRTRRPARPATARLPPGLAPAGLRKAGCFHSDRVGPAASAAGLPHSAPGSCGRWVGWRAPRQSHRQRNALCTVPKRFSQGLPNLTWLHLRSNGITALPSGVGCHKHLKTLLLERNPIKMLPVAVFKKMSVSEAPPPLVDLSAEREPNEEAIHSQEAEGTMVTEKAGFFPPVGKLDLRECRRSAEPPEDWPSEEEIRRFWKLRQEIVENQQAEVLERQRLPAELPPALTAVLSDKEKRRPRPRPVFRTRTPSFKSVLPELAPWQQTQGRTGLPEESIGPDGAAQEPHQLPVSTTLWAREAGWRGRRPPPSGCVRPGGAPAGGQREAGREAGSLCPAHRSRCWVPAAPPSLTPGPRGGCRPSS